jgi:hypothetical protein
MASHSLAKLIEIKTAIAMLVKKMRQSETLDTRAPAGPWFARSPRPLLKPAGAPLFPDEAITAYTSTLAMRVACRDARE